MTKKLIITKKEAIAKCKEMWKLIQDSNMTKYEFLRHHPEWRNLYRYGCSLCEYQNNFPKDDDCEHCPLMTKYHKSCVELGYKGSFRSTPKWMKAVLGL